MDSLIEIKALGQAGYLIAGAGMRIAIDPYLTDSAAAGDARWTRLFPPPIAPEELCVDVFIVTHDHLDHLDPQTIAAYRYMPTTQFIAPRLAARHLLDLGIAPENLHVVDHAESWTWGALDVEGVFALGTTPDTLDTCGYKLTFGGEKSIYHSSDTSYCKLLLDSAPYADVLLVCINGKLGNLDIEEAAALTNAVAPRYVLPNHFDVMALNAEHPESFRYALEEAGIASECIVLRHGETFTF